MRKTILIAAAFGFLSCGGAHPRGPAAVAAQNAGPAEEANGAGGEGSSSGGRGSSGSDPSAATSPPGGAASGGDLSGGDTSVGGAGTSGGSSGGSSGKSGTSGSSGSSGVAEGGSSGGAGAGGASGGGQAGLLTAGLWDDNLNYDFFKAYLAAHAGIPGDPGFSTRDYDAAHSASARRSAHQVIDAAVVIDTTGSMADELSYLQAEFANITQEIAAAFPNADQRWALVCYRDRPDTDPGDEYVTRVFDFTADPGVFSNEILAQTADNGGDYPEAPDLGLAQVPGLSWRTGSDVGKIVFWVADAPQHTAHAADMKASLQGVFETGARLYPVSGSGTDELLEFTMRTAAQLSGGRYLFLTDDSGIGGAHKVPEIPCFFVEKLEKALVRVASMELSGAYLAPDPSDIIRTVGDPDLQAGTCTYQDGETFRVF